MIHVIRRYERVSSELIGRFEGIAAATVHEAYGRQGAMAARIKPIYSGMRLCGTALTVKAHPGDNLMLHKAIDICQPGEVIVVDHDGYEGGAWGENMTMSAMAKGCAGLVTNGCVRDTLNIKALGFSVFSIGVSMKGTSKETLGLINHPISCGGVVVYPGDLVVGDDDGVCVVKREKAVEVLELAQAREAMEAERQKAYQKGKSAWNSNKLNLIAASKGLVEEEV